MKRAPHIAASLGLACLAGCSQQAGPSTPSSPEAPLLVAGDASTRAAITRSVPEGVATAPAPAPRGDDADARREDAEAMASARGGRATIWMDEGALFVVAPGGAPRCVQGCDAEREARVERALLREGLAPELEAEREKRRRRRRGLIAFGASVGVAAIAAGIAAAFAAVRDDDDLGAPSGGGDVCFGIYC